MCCQDNVHSLEPASIIDRVLNIMTAVSVVLLILILAGCQSAKNITVRIEVPRTIEGTTQAPTVNVGVNNKAINVPVNTTIPMSTLGL